MEFKVESFCQPYLAQGAGRLDSIITVSSTASQAAARSDAVIGLIIDVSGSMQGDRIVAAKNATRRAIAMLNDNTHFFVVAFSTGAKLVYPLSQATAAQRTAADDAVRRLEAGGTTVMSRALQVACEQFQRMPGAIHKALFLTDGKNNDNDGALLEQALQASEGTFQCDCRGVGTDWEPNQLRKIALKLLGTAQIIAEPAQMEADFHRSIDSALAMAVTGVQLRLWHPKSAKLLTVKQMSPEIVPLTEKGKSADGQTWDFPTGAWGSESRDYYVAMQLSPGDMGDEMLAVRPSVVFHADGADQKAVGPNVVATWTDDESLSTRINPEVAHYTGQEELAQEIQEGLEAREKGDEDSATVHLGRAAKLAHESGNDETTNRLKKVVDIVDADHGTVRLRRDAKKADTMDLDLGSSRTARRPSRTA